jgi:AcrR family transcriptional regulator
VELHQERLLGAMVNAVTARGYQATTVSEVSSSAHVARAAFYRAFPGGKEECFLAAYDRSVDKLLALAAEAYDEANANGSSGVEAALHAITQRLAQHPQQARMCLLEVTTVGASGLRHRDRALAQMAVFLQTILGGPHGHRSISASKAQALVGGCHQLLYLTVAEGRTSELPALVPDMLYMLLAFRVVTSDTRPITSRSRA